MRRAVAPYIECDSSGSLPVTFKSGNIHAHSCHLKVEPLQTMLTNALGDDSLPLQLSMVYLKDVKLNIPWTLSGDLEILIDEVSVLVTQRELHDTSPEEAREKKEDLIRHHMGQLLGIMTAQEAAAKAKDGSNKKGGGEGAPPGAMLMRLLRKLLEKCRPRVEIRSVHVRYEQTVASHEQVQPQHSIAIA